MQVPSTDLIPVDAAAVVEQPAEPSVQNPLLMVHSLLRGRYWITAILVIVGLIGGSVGGYFVKKPQYQSVGLVRVRPILPRILYQSEQNSVMPMFDAFIESQVSLVRGQRVLDLAMQNPEWQKLGRGLTPDVIAKFNESLEVAHPRNSELVSVTFLDKDPTVAMTAVKVVIQAYEKLYGDNDADSSVQRVQVLEERKVALSAQLKGVQDSIQTIGNDFGTTSLEDLYQFKLSEVNKTESRLKEISLLLAEANSANPDGATTNPASELTPERVSLVVPEMKQLVSEKRSLQRKLDRDELRLGAKHQQIKEEQALVADVQSEIMDLLEQYTPDEISQLEARSGLTAAGNNLERLKANEKSIATLLEKEKTELINFGRTSLKLKSLQADADSITSRLDETKKRIEQLTVEGSVSGRVTVPSYGDKPVEPFNDKRIQFAVAGGMGLGGLAFGVMLLLGYLDQRVRHISDAEHAVGPMHRLLGVLPSLPADLVDPDELAMAAHSVHHIRALLQMRHAPGSCPSFAITSPSAGAGKTSLSLALGLSFAASGSRTLLIDCDMVGGGLTSAMTKVANRKIGHILCRTGLIDQNGVEQTLRRMEGSGMRFGEAAINLGLVTAADVEHAIYVQQDTPVGLREALAGEPLADCITGTGVSGLFLLPLGSAGRQHVGQLSVAAVKSLIKEGRSSFDAIILDTGPIMGSLDASVATAAADEAVLVVARGERRNMTQRAMSYLEAVGARVAGLVFNKAFGHDIDMSGISSSVSRTPVMLPSELPVRSPAERSIRLGPVGMAVDALTETPSESKSKSK